MARLESRLDERINGLESRVDAIEKQFGELRERMAHPGGLLEGLRESITGRTAANTDQTHQAFLGRLEELGSQS